MKVLFCGDIVGAAGRKVVAKYVPQLRKKFNIDCVIANGENSAHGFGITVNTYNTIINSGVDVITLGNHAFDKREIEEILSNNHNIIRPLNYKQTNIGQGYCLFYTKSTRILVVNLVGNIFMGERYSNVFEAINSFLNDFSLKNNADVIIIDLHAETASEKTALAMWLDGKVSAVLGTHTHIPTMDSRILKKGTALQTDVGMCGDYESVIGMRYENSIARFITPNLQQLSSSGVKTRLEPAEAEGTLAASLIEFNTSTGMAKSITPIIIGPHLNNTINLT